MDGPYSPRRCALREVRIPRFSRPITTKIPPWNLAFVGSRIPRPLPPYGSRNLNVLPPWRCSPSSACWSTASSSGRCASLSTLMTSRCRETTAQQRPPRRRSCWPYLHKWHWSNSKEVIKRVSRSMVYSPITCCAVTRWASTAHGMRRPQHKKTVGAFSPLERGLEDTTLLLVCQELLELPLCVAQACGARRPPRWRHGEQNVG